MKMFARKLINPLISLSSFVSLPSTRSSRLLSELASNTHSDAKKLIAVIQLNGSTDREANHRVSERLIREAASYGCSMAFLPENFDGKYFTKEGVKSARVPIDGPMINKYRDLARSLNIWLSLGSFHEKPKDIEGNKRYNTHVIIKSDGEIEAVYRKLHLFDVPDAPGYARIIESSVVIPGDEMVPPIQTPIGKLGLGVCYDIRFPEFGIALAKAGADVLTFPSYYSMNDGAAIWEPMLRTRAIENQCYVIGACHTGIHDPNHSSWGHSMIVDPRGTVIAQVGEDVGLAVALIDPDLLRKARVLLPDLNLRRPEMYGEIKLRTD